MILLTIVNWTFCYFWAHLPSPAPCLLPLFHIWILVFELSSVWNLSWHWAMGISQDSWQKSGKTGHKRKSPQEANIWSGMPATSNTVWVGGGNKNYGTLRLYIGNFSCTCKTKMYVVYNASSNMPVHTETLVKNSTPYQRWYKSHLSTVPGPQEGDQADSWGGRDFKQKAIKEKSEEIWSKKKECQC